MVVDVTLGDNELPEVLCDWNLAGRWVPGVSLGE